jgi:hypothetical protein
LIPALLLALLISACGASSSITQLKEYPARPDDCEVEVLTSEPKDRPYEDLCILNAETGRDPLSDNRASALIETLKRSACRCGADTIIIRLTQDGSVSPLVYESGRAMAVAIRYTD